MSDARTTWAPQRVLADLERLALRASTRAEFFDEAAARLKRVVAFDGACWQTHDPGSDLITQHRLQDIEDHFPVVAHNEYAVDDVNKFARLARAERKAATISQATGGHPERSPRFRDLLNPGGYGPELRSVFVADRSSWGSVILVRRAGQPEFEDRDVDLVADASALFARAVRRGLVAEACAIVRASSRRSGGHPARPLWRAGERVVVGRSAARRALGKHPRGRRPLAGDSRSSQRDADGDSCRRPGAPPDAPERHGEDTGRYLAGAPRGPPRRPPLGLVAVFIQRAHPTLVAPLLLKAYCLTPREQDVTQLMLRGTTTIQAAQRLEISPHTITDHMKSIFEKTGARTRGELSATLFFGEHLPRIQHLVPVGDDASFIDAPRPRHDRGPEGRTTPH